MWDRFKRFFSGAASGPSRDFRIEASGPVPEGAITVSLSTVAPPSLFVSDLGKRGLRMEKGVSYDLGNLYTQKQINDSYELKTWVSSGQILVAIGIGTIPSLERTTIAGVSLTIPPEMVIRDPSDPTHKLKIEADGSIIVTSVEDSRPKYYVFDNTQTAQVDKEYDFGGTMKDIWLYVGQDSIIKWNSIDQSAIELSAGEYDFSNQYASKAFITNTVDMNVEIYANGGI